VRFSRLFVTAFFSCMACRAQATVQQKFAPSAEFDAYWNSGVAELSRYSLIQARYGELHKGELIAIVVTEPFRTDKQVKSELTPGQNDTAVLKAQLMRRFATGFYDYTLTTTSFKELDPQSLPLKVTGSAVDWCGHSWLQLNLKGGRYGVQSRSYFEEFADEDFSLAAALSEDDIWQRIRLEPSALPTGEIRLIPSLVSSRLRHRRPAGETAMATLDLTGKKGSYALVYDAGREDERRVEFIFEKGFPYAITEFRETYLDGFQRQKKLTTVAKLTGTKRSAYWREHEPQHLKFRKELGVKGFNE
jgi:hypothetical protein